MLALYLLTALSRHNDGSYLAPLRRVEKGASEGMLMSKVLVDWSLNPSLHQGFNNEQASELGRLSIGKGGLPFRDDEL